MSVIITFLLCSLLGFIFFYLSNKKKYRFAVLSIISCLFIGLINYFSLIIVLFMTTLTYLVSLRIIKNKKYENLFFYFGIGINMLVFFSYKYFEDFIFPNTVSFSQTGFKVSNWIIIGIGYYTLQHISFLINVKKNKVVVESIRFYLSSISFFKILSGPIIDPFIFKKEINNIDAVFNKDLIVSGYQRILLGIAKKIIIADRLATFVNNNYILSNELPGWEILVASIAFTLQLYFDFSGYIDIAIGSARLFGIQIPENFNLPFRSASIAEFWRRWHITLINWFTINIFYPINYKYRRLRRTAVITGIIVTFLLSAIWHGLGITYLLWAFCHIIYLCFDLYTSKWKNDFEKKGLVKIKRIFFIISTFLLVCISNIFFRAANVTTAFSMFKNLFNVKNFFPYMSNFKVWLISGAANIELIFNLRLGLLLAFIFIIYEKKILILSNSKSYNWKYVAVILFLIFFLGIFDAATRFIYMQF